MEKLKKQSRKLVMISMLFMYVLTTNFSSVLAATDENNSISYYDQLILVLESDETLTSTEYRELLLKVLEENPYFLITLNDDELSVLEKIYNQVFSEQLKVHINTNNVSLLFFGLPLLADLKSLLNNIPVDLYVEVTPTLDSDNLNILETLVDVKAYQDPFDVFTLEVKQIIHSKQKVIHESDIPIRILRYNIEIVDEPEFIKAYSIQKSTIQELDSIIYSHKVMQIKTYTLDGFSLLSIQTKEIPPKKFLGWADLTIDSNRLFFSGALLIGVGILIGYLMKLALKTKKQVEA
jgi:hypothetical protein